MEFIYFIYWCKYIKRSWEDGKNLAFEIIKFRYYLFYDYILGRGIKFQIGRNKIETLGSVW